MRISRKSAFGGFVITFSRRHALAATASLVALVSAAGSALAEAETTTAAPGDETTRVEDVTVVGQAVRRGAVATKTDTPLVETPQSISVIPAELIMQRGALSLQEALGYTAGVRADSYGNDGRVDSFTARGASPAQFLDGMRLAYGFYNAAKVDPYALSGIEVVRGPSSVLYGQGTVAGVVNMNSKRPLFERRGEVIASYGTWDRKQVQADLTGPIDAAGHFAFRLTGLYRDADTQVDRIGDKRWFLAGSLTWRPTMNTDVTLLVHRQEDSTGSTTQFFPWEGTIFDNPNGRIPSSTFQGEPDWEAYKPRQTNVSIFTRHNFADGLEFRQNARAIHTKMTYQTMYPNSYTNPTNPWIQAGQPGYTGPKRSIVRTISASYPEVWNYSVDNQLQAKLDTGPLSHTLVGGVDGQSYKQKLMQATGRASTPIDLFNPVYGNYVRPTAVRGPTTKQTQLGYYLQDQIKLGELNILAGVRKDSARSRTISATNLVTRTKDSATTFRVGALYTLPGGIAPYVSYAESFLPVAGANLAGEPFNPQMGKQWEAGVKWQPNANLLATAAVYDLRDTNRVTVSPTNPLDRVQTGEVKTTGIELELQATLADVWTVTGGYTYTDAKVSRSNNPLELGKPLASVPLHAFSAWVMRRFDLKDGSAIRIGAGVRHYGETEDRNLAAPLFTLTTPSYTLADLMVSYERDNWRLSVNANNLFDKYYYSSCLTRGDCFIGARRTVNATLAYRF
jgi:iron complex outermembrane receptor protein